MIQEKWLKKWIEIPQNYDGFEIDVFQIMPNHLHGIINVVGAGPCGRPNTARHNNINRADIDLKQKNYDLQSVVVMEEWRILRTCYTKQ